ncbi:MAG: hypothetical protein HYX67_00695 [Candidatus Melainabacteria bacterium]|nr:hypothetical protein [Candidatus Melainabacteria bacterium]
MSSLPVCAQTHNPNSPIKQAPASVDTTPGATNPTVSPNLPNPGNDNSKGAAVSSTDSTNSISSLSYSASDSEPTAGSATAPSTPSRSTNSTASSAPSTSSDAPRAIASKDTGKDSDDAAGAANPTGSAGDTGNGISIAQSNPKPAQTRRNPIPGIVGTVKIRKQFKLFANEQLIHNMSFRDTPVREVIAELARRGNLNIIIDKSVVGKITGDLRDVTLNEAMDSVLASAGLQSRTLDNSTVIVATLQAMVQLGLNRPLARAFKLSYAHPYDVAMILHASIFNRGMLPDFNSQLRRRSSNEVVDTSESGRQKKAGGSQPEGDVEVGSKNGNTETDKSSSEQDSSQTNRPDSNRRVSGSSRSQTQEGVGFNNAATDPGSQQIRSFQEINTDYTVEQNGGGAIVIPDAKNRQILVVGTQEDINIAEESIKLLDRRPKQVHIQASLIELTNQGIRQLGATLNVQGEGASSSVLGNSRAPLIQYLPGLGSTFPSPAAPFGTTLPTTNPTPVTPTTPGTAFTGLVGSLLPVAPSIAGIQASQFAQSAFNFLTGGKGTGGKQNIATVPTALNLDLQLLLQTNKAKVVANPSVVVVDDTETLITIASEVVHKVTSTVSLGVVTTNVELTKAGIFLNVLPKVTEDGFVTMRLRPQVSTPLGPPQVFGSSASPTIVTLLNVREIMSQEVRVKDGQTLVLGGLFSEQEAAQLAKVPYLAEAPILGALFRNSLKGRNRSELMLLLTPKIVEDDPTSITDSQTSPTL